MKPRVLVVDDDIDYARLIAYNLERQGCEAVTAYDGVEALRVARAQLPDVILLDLMLPDLDGLAVCEILQAQPSTRDIPILIISALDQSWVDARKTKAKAAHYFTKPVDLKVLAASVQVASEERQKYLKSKLAQTDN